MQEVFAGVSDAARGGHTLNGSHCDVTLSLWTPGVI